MITRKRFITAISSFVLGDSVMAQPKEINSVYGEELHQGFAHKGTFSDGLEYLRYQGGQLLPSRFRRLIFEYRYNPEKSFSQVDIRIANPCTLGAALIELANKMNVRVILKTHNQCAILVDEDDHTYDEEFRKAEESLKGSDGGSIY